MEKFSTRLRELRLEEGLSQYQLAVASGLSQTAIAHWELEKRVPNANAVIALAKFFDVTTDYILGLTDGF